MTTMVSADFSRQALHHASDKKNVRTSVRPPRVRTITFIPYTCCIYLMDSGQYRTTSSGSLGPCMQFLSVRPGLCRQLPSDFTSRWAPLLLANTSCCQACSGLTPYSYRPCRAHKQKTLSTYCKEGYRTWSGNRTRTPLTGTGF